MDRDQRNEVIQSLKAQESLSGALLLVAASGQPFSLKCNQSLQNPGWLALVGYSEPGFMTPESWGRSDDPLRAVVEAFVMWQERLDRLDRKGYLIG